MAWPALTDFSEAIQNPLQCFGGTELEDAKVATNQRGLPLVFSGSFASVYSVTSGGRSFAVRCFTREVRDQQRRYNHISDYLINVLPPSFVHFEYVVKGIKFRGDWYPIVKMEWVEGDLLNKFIESRLNDPSALRYVAAQWRGGAMASMRGLRIAHNDLQHGNVMVQSDGTIRLVDYDGLYLPKFLGESSPELGHKNFQHPQRSPSDYCDYIDNFPSLVIYLSLLSIASDPGLWTFNNDDNLIFTRKDFDDPKGSKIFNRLKRSSDPAVTRLTEKLEECCGLSVARIPDLESILHDIPASSAPANLVANPARTKSTPTKQPAPVPQRRIIQRRKLRESRSTPKRPTSPTRIPQPVSRTSQLSTWHDDKPWLKWFLYGFGALLLAWLLQTEFVSFAVNALLIIAGIVATIVFLVTKNPLYLIGGAFAFTAFFAKLYDSLIDVLWPWIGILAAAAIVFTGFMDILNSEQKIRKYAVGAGMAMAVLCAVAFVIT